MLQTDTHLFATPAPPILRVGSAVVPAGDKVPIRRGCGNRCSAPGLRTVAKWAELTETVALDDAEVMAEDFAVRWGIGRTTVRERLSCAPTGRETCDRLTDAGRRVPP